MTRLRKGSAGCHQPERSSRSDEATTHPDRRLTATATETKWSTKLDAVSGIERLDGFSMLGYGVDTYAVGDMSGT